jgi:hypothetical protein
MSTGEEDMSGGSGVSRGDQVLDELDHLASVEHALLVDYLSVFCALGHDLPPAGGGASAQRVRDAASAAFSLALGEMAHLRRVNGGLTLAGRQPQVGRAVGISSDGVGEVALGPPSLAQLERLLEREHEIASAVDERYARLQSAVTPADPVLSGKLLEQVTFILETCSHHVSDLATLREPLEGLAPSDFLRATRREATDALERSLLELSDQYYGVIVATVQTWSAHDEQLGGQLRSLAVATMDRLNEIHFLLVERGLLPPFTLPSAVAGAAPETA